MAVTRLGTSATPERNFSSFAGRAPSGGRSVGKIIQLQTIATPGRRFGSFSAKSSGSTRTVGRIIQLQTIATPGRRFGAFTGRTTSGGGTTGGFSRALVVNNPMSEPLKQSTARNKAVFLVLTTDHVTGATGMAGAMTIYASKDGGAAGLITPTVTEISAANMPGHYSLAFSTVHTNTLGDLAVHISAAGADPCDFILPVEVERTGLLAASAIQAIWDALTSALTTAGSIGKRIADFLTGDAFVRLGAPAGASVSADVAAVRVDTQLITTTPQAELSAVPAVNASPLTKINWMYLLVRNRLRQTNSNQALRNAADSANIAVAATSDDGTTYIKDTWT